MNEFFKAYKAKWPVRHYQVFALPLAFTTTRPDLYKAYYRLAFDVRTRARRTEGDASCQVLVLNEGGKLSIMSYTETIDRRSVTRFTK